MATSNSQLRDLISSSDDAVAVAAGKLFPIGRKILRAKGVRDALTPRLFAAAFANVLAEIRKGRVPEWSDFNSLLNNALGREASAERAGRDLPQDSQATIAAQCVAVLDGDARRLLFLRYAEAKTYEQIATDFNFGNAVIAQFETDKAYKQYEGLVRVRFQLEAAGSLAKPDQLLIERFLAGHLTGVELEDFNRRRQEQASFAQAVDFHGGLQSGLLIAYQRFYEDLVLSGVRYRRALIPSPLKYILIFLVVMSGGSLLWFYLAPDTGLTSPMITVFQEKDKVEAEQKKPSRKKTSPAAEPAVTDSAVAGDAVSATPDSIAQAASGIEEIVVKKDEMLITFDVQVTDLNDTRQDKDALTNTAVDKLNPAAGLPEQTEVMPASLSTEFWVSPVNYQGYRLMNGKLVLFGIEEPDQVKLYRVKDFLYMGYQNAYYKLAPSDDFIPYQRIKDTEVPLAIRSNR